MQNATAKKLIDHDFRERKCCKENNPLGHIEMPAAILIEASSILQTTEGGKGVASLTRFACNYQNNIILEFVHRIEPIFCVTYTASKKSFTTNYLK